jgi:hypothetical protein
MRKVIWSIQEGITCVTWQGYTVEQGIDTTIEDMLAQLERMIHENEE